MKKIAIISLFATLLLYTGTVSHARDDGSKIPKTETVLNFEKSFVSPAICNVDLLQEVVPDIAFSATSGYVEAISISDNTIPVECNLLPEKVPRLFGTKGDSYNTKDIHAVLQPPDHPQLKVLTGYRHKIFENSEDYQVMKE